MPDINWYFESEQRDERAFGIDSLPTHRYVYRRLSPAQQATLFSVPVTIIPGKPKKIMVVTHVHVRKEAGTIWNSAGSGVLGIRFGSAGTFQFNHFNQAITTDFFGADEDVWVAEQGAGSFASLGYTTGTAASNGADIKLALATADISGGTGDLHVQLWYREWRGLS